MMTHRCNECRKTILGKYAFTYESGTCAQENDKTLTFYFCSMQCSRNYIAANMGTEILEKKRFVLKISRNYLLPVEPLDPPVCEVQNG